MTGDLLQPFPLCYLALLYMYQEPHRNSPWTILQNCGGNAADQKDKVLFPTPRRGSLIMYFGSKTRIILQPIARQRSTNRHLIVSRLEFLYQQYFGFLLVSGSENDPILNLNSRKDSLYQDYPVCEALWLLQHVGALLRQSCCKLQQTFEHKLFLIWVKEP